MKIIHRSFKRLFKKGYNNFTKVMLLGVALAMSLVMISKIYFETSYESYVPELDRTYRFVGEYGNEEDELKTFDNTSGGIAPQFQNFSPSVEFVSRFATIAYSTTVSDAENLSQDAPEVSALQVIAADSMLFEIFNVPITGSNPKTVLSSITSDNIYISRSLAEKLTNNQDINSLIGKRFSVTSLRDKPNYVVAGIYDDFPEKSYIGNVDVIAPIAAMIGGMDNLVGNERYSSFVRLRENTDIQQAQNELDNMNSELIKTLENGEMYMKYRLTPLASFHTDKQEVKNLINILSILLFSIFFVAILNYILITISSLVARSKEIAMHKLYGASSGVIHRMLVSDALAAILLSLALSALLIAVFSVEIEKYTSSSLTSMFDIGIVPIIMIVVLIALLICGLIPATIYSKVPVSVAFQRLVVRKKMWKYALLTLQIAGSTFLVSLLVITATQYYKLVNQDVGYAYDNVLTVNVSKLDKNDREVLRRELSQIPLIKTLSFSSTVPMNSQSGSAVMSEDVTTELFGIANQFVADENFVELYGITIIEGRNFSATSPKGKEVLVSQRFVDEISKHQDWSDGAVGKSLQFKGYNSINDIYTVCGVYQDYMLGSALKNDTRPSALFFSETETGFFADFIHKLSITTVNEIDNESVNTINSCLEKLFPDLKSEAEIYSTQMTELYSENKKNRDLVFLCSLVVLIITLIGLIGYTRDEIARRRAEIAIRKIHGATTGEVIQLFLRDTRWLLLFGLVAGGATTYFASGLLLEMFAYKIALSWWIFALSALLVTVIITTVVVLTTHKAADANPVENLKSE